MGLSAGMGNSDRFPRGKPAATESRFPILINHWYNYNWVFSCFHNPPNSDLDYSIFNVRTWSIIVMRVYAHAFIPLTQTDCPVAYYVLTTICLCVSKGNLCAFWIQPKSSFLYLCAIGCQCFRRNWYICALECHICTRLDSFRDYPPRPM